MDSCDNSSNGSRSCTDNIFIKTNKLYISTLKIVNSFTVHYSLIISIKIDLYMVVNQRNYKNSTKFVKQTEIKPTNLSRAHEIPINIANNIANKSTKC